MQKAMILGVVGLMVFLLGCEDKKAVSPVDQPTMRTKQETSHLDLTVPLPRENVITPLQQAQKQATDSIKQSVASVTHARHLAAKDIFVAVENVELGVLEDSVLESPAPNMIASEKKKSQHKIEVAVEQVAHAKSASAAKIVASVEAVEAARDASSVSAPAMVEALDVIKAQSRAKIAKSVSAVEVAKAKASAQMAENTSNVEASRRLYGDDAKETQLAKSHAIGSLATSVGVAEAKALGEISESVAAVEIAKAKAGVKSDNVLKGQELYLKQLKKACGISGADFAKSHTREEWKRLKETGTYLQEVQALCPNLHPKEAWIAPLFAYTCAYAKGSDSIPACH